MKSERSSNHKRKLMIVVMLLSIMVCFTQKVWVTRKATVDEFPGGILTGYFNADGGVNFYTIDTAYCNDMTFLLGKKTLHPFIIVDIDKAKLSHDVTEKELMNSPYCYLSIATTGRIYFDDFVRATFPWGKVVGDTLIDYETLSLGEWMYKKTGNYISLSLFGTTQILKVLTRISMSCHLTHQRTRLYSASPKRN